MKNLAKEAKKSKVDEMNEKDHTTVIIAYIAKIISILILLMISPNAIIDGEIFGKRKTDKGVHLQKEQRLHFIHHILIR